MPTARTDKLIRDWGGRLQANALAARVLGSLKAHKSEVQRCALDGLQRENPAFGRAASPEFQAEAIGHCNDILEVMLAVATGGVAALAPDPFGFVQAHAVRRARQQFSLAGSLNAYRLAHKGYWTVMRDAVMRDAGSEDQAGECLMLLSEFLLEFFDVLSGVLTDAHIAEENSLIARRTRARVALIEDLMHGRLPGDVEATTLCERCGVRLDGPLAVAVARILAAAKSGNGHDVDREAELRRLSQLVDGALADAHFGKLVDVRDGEVLVIVSSETATSRAVVTALRGAAATLKSEIGSAVGIGVSLDAAAGGTLPRAYQEAERAVEFATPDRPVMHFADIDLLELLVRRPDDAALRLIPEWAGRLRAADGEKAGELSRTIRVFADCNLNVKQTAHRLGLHTNTVYFRLNRIGKLTGVDPRSFAGASLLLTTLRLLEARSSGRESQP